jgi:hypothetical protein
MVGTAMANPSHPWTSECRIAIGRVLVRHGGGPLTATEIGAESERNASNVKKAADGLVADGVLQKRDPPVPAVARPGAKARNCYAFAPGAQDAFEAAWGPEPNPGSLAPGDQLIFLDAREPGPGLLDCLTNAALSARVHWAALCDGTDQELMIALRGPNAVNASLDLMGAFKAAKLKARRVAIAKIDSAAELSAWAAQSQQLARGN